MTFYLNKSKGFDRYILTSITKCSASFGGFAIKTSINKIIKTVKGGFCAALFAYNMKKDSSEELSLKTCPVID